MSAAIHKHADALHHFFETLKKQREVKIYDANFDRRILHLLSLSGKEARAIKVIEIYKVLEHYGYFKEFFTKKGLWIKYPELFYYY